MFKRAERKMAKFAVIIGEDEINRREVIIKNLETKQQKTVALDKLVETINSDLGEYCEDCSCE